MGGELWIDLFREVGLNEERMRHWHMLFEARHPEAHAVLLHGWDCSQVK